jgi:polysaccharide export outer membrane protein
MLKERIVMKTVLALAIVALLASTAAAQTPTTSPQPTRPAPGATPATGDTRSTVPTPTGTRGTTLESVGTDYRLTAGDKLRIEVYREPQLSQSVEIRPDGKVTLPLVGDIAAAGVTASQLSSTLTERFREYVTTPVVTVIVAEAAPPMVYVMGEVRTPGSQVIRGPLTVLQALAVAGGFNEFANTKKIRILRRGTDGAVQSIKFNYKDALAHPEQPMLLQPGDTVIVP